LDHEEEQKKMREGRSEEDLRAEGGESLVVHSCFGAFLIFLFVEMLRRQTEKFDEVHNDGDRPRPKEKKKKNGRGMAHIPDRPGAPKDRPRREGLSQEDILASIETSTTHLNPTSRSSKLSKKHTPSRRITNLHTTHHLYLQV
jgi:hypothetical protein